MSAALAPPVEQPPLWDLVDEPAPRPRPGRRWRARCTECHHPIRVPDSLAWRYGPKCRRKLGLTKRRLRLGRVRDIGPIDGQIDLFERISA